MSGLTDAQCHEMLTNMIGNQFTENKATSLRQYLNGFVTMKSEYCGLKEKLRAKEEQLNNKNEKVLNLESKIQEAEHIHKELEELRQQHIHKELEELRQQQDKLLREKAEMDMKEANIRKEEAIKRSDDIFKLVEKVFGHPATTHSVSNNRYVSRSEPLPNNPDGSYPNMSGQIKTTNENINEEKTETVTQNKK